MNEQRYRTMVCIYSRIRSKVQFKVVVWHTVSDDRVMICSERRVDSVIYKEQCTNFLEI